jgi:hypothetical protein
MFVYCVHRPAELNEDSPGTIENTSHYHIIQIVGRTSTHEEEDDDNNKIIIIVD